MTRYLLPIAAVTLFIGVLCISMGIALGVGQRGQAWQILLYGCRASDHWHPAICLGDARVRQQYRLTDPTYRAEQPVWSPDGTQIAFIKPRASYTEASIYLMDMRTTQREIRYLSALDTRIIDMLWVDDALLLWTALGSTQQIYRVDTRDGRLEIIPEDISNRLTTPVLSPDARYEVYWQLSSLTNTSLVDPRASQGDGLYLHDRQTDSITQLHSVVKSMSALVWSANSRQVGFYHLIEKQFYVIDLQQPQQLQYILLGETVAYPRWRPVKK